MEEIYLRDRGGIQPDASDILTDELVSYLDGVNTTLGTKDDPRFGEYQEFLNSIAEASILKIEPDQMSSGRYDDLDLTGDQEKEDYPIPNVPDSTFTGPNLTLSQLLTAMVFATPFNMDKGKVIDKQFAPVFDENWVLPNFVTK